jgi:hypothetical protein
VRTLSKGVASPGSARESARHGTGIQNLSALSRDERRSAATRGLPVFHVGLTPRRRAQRPHLATMQEAQWCRDEASPHAETDQASSVTF